MSAELLTPLLRFPIPMRGNEWHLDLESVPAVPEFPIPMRGNEETDRVGQIGRFVSFRSP